MLCFLLHYQCWALTGTPLGYPAVALCCGNPAALGLQDQFLHMLQQIPDGVGQHLAVVLCLGRSACQLSLVLNHEGELSCIALASSPRKVAY